MYSLVSDVVDKVVCRYMCVYCIYVCCYTHRLLDDSQKKMHGTGGKMLWSKGQNNRKWQPTIFCSSATNNMKHLHCTRFCHNTPTNASHPIVIVLLRSLTIGSYITKQHIGKIFQYTYAQYSRRKNNDNVRSL
jgi:hypothetical protein